MRYPLFLLTLALIVISISACEKKDLLPPILVPNGDSEVSIPLGGTYVEEGATATDNEDGVISSPISVDASAVNTDSLGSYEVVYSVSDAAGNFGSGIKDVHVYAGNSEYAGTWDVIDSCIDGSSQSYTVTISEEDSAFILIENLSNYFPDSLASTYDIRVRIKGKNGQNLEIPADTVGSIIVQFTSGTLTETNGTVEKFELDHNTSIQIGKLCTCYATKQ